MINLLRRISFITIRVTLVVVVLLFLLPLLFKKSIEQKAKKEINNLTNAEVNFDRVSISFFKDFPNPTVSLHDLYIIGEKEFNGDTLTAVNEAAIELGLKSLLFG